MKRILFFLLSCWAAAQPAAAQEFRWVQTGLNGTSPNIQNYSATAAIAQGNGRLAAAGYFHEEMTFTGQPTMVGIYQPRTAFAGSWQTDGTVNWVQPALSTRFGEAQATGVDAAGNSYVAYLATGDISFGATQVPVSGSGRSTATVLVKFSPAGQVLWTRKLEASYSGATDPTVLISSLAVTANGSCVLGGQLYGTLALAGQPALVNNAAYGWPMAILLRIEANGSYTWTRAITGTGSEIKAVAVDASDNLWVAGGCGGTTDFGSGVTVTWPLYSSFVARYNSQGVPQWAQLAGASNNRAGGMALGVAPDAAGNVFICGYFGNGGGDNQNHTGMFGPLTLTTTGNSGYSDGYLAKYDAQGMFQWVRTLRGADTEWARAVAVSQRGEVYLSGAAYGGVQFGTTTLTANTFGYQGYVAKYSATGDLRWLQGYGGSGTPFGGSNLYAGLGLITDGAGHLYVAGAFMGNTYFGTIYQSGPNQGVNYPYIAALDDLEIVTAAAHARPDLVALTAYPNPSTGQVQLRWPATPRPLPLTVLDALGRTVHAATLPAAQATATLQLAHLPKGVYVLRLTDGARVMTRRLVLQ